MASFGAGYIIGSASADSGAAQSMTSMARRLGACLGGRTQSIAEQMAQAQQEKQILLDAYTEIYQQWHLQNAEIASLRQQLGRAHGV